MDVLVTGGAGYIGSHLVDALVARGHKVVVIDDLSTGNLSNLRDHEFARVAYPPRPDAKPPTGRDVTFVEGDILDSELVIALVAEADLVFHLAAAVGVRYIVEKPLASLQVNTRGTEIVLGACHRLGKRVVVASTSEVYGKTAKVPFEEDDDRVLGPTTVHRWGYSTSKAFDEHLALAYADEGLEVAIVRYFNSYGPRLDPRGYGSVVANFIRQSLAGEALTVHGDGMQSRSFTYIDDTVSGTLAAGTSEKAPGAVFNLGNPEEITIIDLANKIKEMVGSESQIEFVPYEEYYGPGFEDTRRRVPAIDRARRRLGWEPRVSLEEGLERTIEWWRETRG